MGFGKLRIQLQRLPGCADQFWTHFVWWGADTKRPKHVIDGGQTDVSRCKVRVLSDRLLKVGNALFNFALA